MVVFPNCKINLGLQILQKRPDGFHDLETVFYPVGLHDALEIIQAENSTHLTVSGFSAGKVASNLVLKAYHLLKNDYPQLPEINMHLHKAVPMGAGLGGGSADAAFALQLLQKKFNLPIQDKKLKNYALQLGSDCPFFLINTPCIASGRGEELTALPVSLTGFRIMLVHPGIHISTAAAFSAIRPGFPKKSIREIIQQPIGTWKEDLINDFEKNIFAQYPRIRQIKEELYDAGAVYAAMSGSGSSVFGLFEKDPDITYPAAAGYFSRVIAL